MNIRTNVVFGTSGALLLALAGAACGSSSSDAVDAVDSGGALGADGGGTVTTPPTSDAGADATVTQNVDAGDDDVADATDTSANDASTDGASGDAGDASAWTPASFGSALSLWLSADVNITGGNGADAGVVGWLDQSPHQNPATAAAGELPSLTMVGGHPAIAFNGTTSALSIPDSPSLQVAGELTLIVVAAVTKTAATDHLGILYAKQNLTSPFPGVVLAANYNNSVPATDERGGAQVDNTQVLASTETNLADGTLHVYSTSYAGDASSQNFSLRIDNDTPKTATVQASTMLGAAGEPAYIGGRPGTGQALQGAIAEIILLNDAISPADWAKAYAYLQAKYGLSH